jgi:hypothetical protein
MSRYDDFRAPYGGGGGGGGVRWDSERFVRERERERFGPPRGPPVLEREPPRFDRRPVEPPLANRRPTRFEETYFAEEKYAPPARRPDRYYEEQDFYERPTRGPPAGAMVPYDRARRDDYDLPGGRRPGLLRRQSSLDTFDRQPTRRYDEYEREDYRRPPEPIPVPLPPRGRGPETLERDFEEIRIAEPDYYGDEEYRQFREREWTTRRRPSRPPGPPGSQYSPPASEAFEEVIEEEKPFPRKGKTRMPRRLVHPRAIIELGYPYEEEVNAALLLRNGFADVFQGDTIIILKALGKENIDEVVRVSREIKEKEIRELESKEISESAKIGWFDMH